MKDGGLYSVERTIAHIHVAFPAPRRALSSAVLNGGAVYASHILNLHVPDFSPSHLALKPPEITLRDYCVHNGWRGIAIGMMTAAPMSSFRESVLREGDVEIAALVTAGVTNARRAGDPADWRCFDEYAPTTGTINIVLATNAELTNAAMVEAIQMVTEAKVAAIQNMGIASLISGEIATGTGTDSVAVISGEGSVKLQYCGKHVLFGELLARAVIQAITSSLKGDNSENA
jgi:adenosylcobinamide amidohydrolase